MKDIVCSLQRLGRMIRSLFSGRCFHASLTALLLLVAGGVSVGAEQGAGPDSVAAIEVTVTATRIERAADVVPASVRVLDRQEIERSGASNMVELLPRVPGVTVRSESGALQNAGVSMAGFSQDSVLVLLDGRPLNPPDQGGVDWVTLPVDAVDRVEVMRGPAASQYGDRAVGGVINIITTESRDSFIEVSSSIDNLLSNRQSVTLGYSDSLFDLRTTVLRTQERPSRDRSDANAIGVQGHGTVRPTDTFSFSVSGRYIDSKHELPGALNEDEFEDDPDEAGGLDGQGDGDGEIRTTEYELSLVPAFSGEQLDAELPLALRSQLVEDDAFGSSSDSLTTTYDARPQFSIALDGLVLTPEFTAGTDIRLQTLNFQRFETEDRDDVAFAADVSRTTYAPWLRSRISPVDPVVLEAGARVEFAETSISSDDADDLDDAADLSPLVYDFGVVWQAADFLSLDARYARVFRYPAFDEQSNYPSAGTMFVPADEATFDSELDPEQGHHVTLGAEATFGELGPGALTLAANPYAVFMQDEIAFDPTAPASNTNLDNTRRLGATLETGYAMERFSLSAGYSYTRAEFTDGPNDGNTIPLVPDHSGSAEAEYRLPAGVAIAGDVLAGGDFYKGGDESNEQDRAPGRIELGSRVSWEPEFVEGLRLHAAGKNLLDTRNPTFVSADLGIGEGWYPTPGRRFEIGARFRR